MPEVNNSDLLDSVERYYTEQYPDNPEVIEDALSYAADIIYGINQVPGVSSQSDSDSITEQDYNTYLYQICQNGVIADFYFGDDSTDTLYYDVQRFIDQALQDKLALADRQALFWGECPDFRNRDDEAELFPNRDPFSDPSERQPHAKTDDPKIEKEHKVKNLSFIYIKGADSMVAEKPKESHPTSVRLPQREKSLKEICDELEQEIPQDGPSFTYIHTDGRFCEINYNQYELKQISKRLVIVDQNGKTIDLEKDLDQIGYYVQPRLLRPKTVAQMFEFERNKFKYTVPQPPEVKNKSELAE